MSVSGEGVKTKVVDNVLYVKATNRMLGYLIAHLPLTWPAGIAQKISSRWAKMVI